jgi:hypothetical protein
MSKVNCKLFKSCCWWDLSCWKAFWCSVLIEYEYLSRQVELASLIVLAVLSLSPYMTLLCLLFTMISSILRMSQSAKSSEFQNMHRRLWWS